MNAPLLSMRFGSTPTAAGLAKALVDHACVSVAGVADTATAALLDQTERELSSLRYRCVRISASMSGGLALRDLIAQVVGRPNATGLTDHDLKAGFVALTEPGEDYNLVALLVSEAHNLLPSAVRYLQLACQSSPTLRVVLAGQYGLAAILAQDEFTPLRRMTYALELQEAVKEQLFSPGLAVPESAPVPRPNRSSTLVRLGLATLLMPMVGLIWWRHLPPSPAIETPVGLPSASTPAAQLALVTPVAKEPEVAEEIFPSDPEREPDSTPVIAAAPALAPAPASADPPDEPVPALPEATAEAAVPKPPAAPDEPAESSAIVSVEPPTAAVPEGALEAIPEPQAVAEAVPPAQEAAPTVAQAPEPSVRAPDPAPLLPETTDAAGPAADASPPALPPPTPSPPAVLPLLSTVPPLSPPVSPPVQRARPETPRPAVAVTVPPARLANERRCRDIVLKAQLGKDPSDADKRFLRNGCRAE